MCHAMNAFQVGGKFILDLAGNIPLCTLWKTFTLSAPNDINFVTTSALETSNLLLKHP
jgi:hypothetical protein